MRPRTRYSLLLIFGLIAALAVALFLRKKAPPEVARLLPESDAIVYINLKPIRSLTHFDREWKKRPVEHSTDYQHFLDGTGIVFERDLDAVAFALHRMGDPNGPNGPVAYSEIFEGRFDGTRLASYLGSIASAQETYAGHRIFTIPVSSQTTVAPDGSRREPVRLLRITELGYDTLAASNMPTAEQIHAILDRYRAGASPFAGSSLLSERYGDVPLLSSVWAIGHVGLPFSESGRIHLFGLQVPLPEDTTFVASVRYTTALRLRIDELFPTEAEAAQSAQALTSLLQLFRSVQSLQSQIHPDAKPSSQNLATSTFLDSIRIASQKDRAVLTATIPVELLRQITAAQNESAADSR